MAEPHVEILGIYRLPVTEELYREQFDSLYDYEMSALERAQAEGECRQQLESTVLIEALVVDRDKRFDAGDFTQPDPDEPEGAWQVAWAEAYLTLDGESLLVERWSDPPKTGDLRVAFFVHFWKPDRPLRTSYGEVACPAVEEMPPRLRELFPYETLD